MNLLLHLDKYQHDNLSPLAPHTSVWSTEESFVVSDLVNLPKPIYSTWNNFLNLGVRAEPVSQEGVVPRSQQ